MSRAEREVCAACRKTRATTDDHMGRGCTVSEYGSLCHAADDDACAERRGGWRAIAEEARDEAGAYRDEAAGEAERTAQAVAAEREACADLAFELAGDGGSLATWRAIRARARSGRGAEGRCGVTRPRLTCLCSARDVCPVHDERDDDEIDRETEQRLADEAAEDRARRNEED